MKKRKRILSMLMAISIVIGIQITWMQNAAAEEYPALPCDPESDYVVYQNEDTGKLELAVIQSDEEYSLMLERKEQLGARSGDIYSDNKYLIETVPIERPRLYFSTESSMEDQEFYIESRVSEYYISRWILEGDSWTSAGDAMVTTLCENTGDILETNLPVIEVFRKNDYYYMNNFQVYNGREYYNYYEDYSGETSKRKIEFSEDGINYETKIELPEDTPYAIKQVVYGNDLYIMECDTFYGENFPEWKRAGGYTNKRIYTYNTNYELVHTTELETLRMCAGYTDGYFYFYDREYLDIPYSVRMGGGLPYQQTIDRYYKSADGITYTEIEEEEYKTAEKEIEKKKHMATNGYAPEITQPIPVDKENPFKFILNVANGEEAYEIKYERQGGGISTNRGGSKDFVTVMFADDTDREDTKNRYLTIDGVYGIPLPYYNYGVGSQWTTEEYIYIDINIHSSIYFRIAKEDLMNKAIVRLNDEVLGFSTPPVEENDRILVPMRFLFEQMGAEVEWDEASRTATATVPISAETQLRTFSTASEKSVSFAIDNTTATVNGAEAEMDVPARLVNDKTMVPLRFLSENLGYEVSWDEATQTAIVTTE